MPGVLSAWAQAPGPGSSEAQWQAWGGLQPMPRLEIEGILAPAARLLVVSPCAEEEVLGAAGLMLQAHAHGRELGVLSLSDVPDRLQEPSRALAAMGLNGVPVVRLCMEDGTLQDHEQRLGHLLDTMVRPGDVLVSPWRHDGLPDHESCGRACARSAARLGARLLELPLWCWHWARPGDVRLPWSQAMRLPLTPAECDAKLAALRCLCSQTGRDAAEDEEALWPPAAMDCFLRPFEVFFLT